MIYLFLFLTFLFSPLSAQPALAELRINEIYPAPTNNEFEWVELYNDNAVIANALDYSLYDATGKSVLINSTLIQPFSYVLATSEGVLNNSGETVFLRKNTSVIQTVVYSQNITSLQSFALCPDTNEWKVSSAITKLFINPACAQIATPTPSSHLTPTTNPTVTNEVPMDISNIFISEIMPYPEIGKEWIEIFNNNDFDVALINWSVDDELSGGSSPQKITLIIPSKGYKVIELETSMLNNAGDEVYLLDGESVVKDRITYASSKKGASFGKTDDGSFCFQNPSYEKQNNKCILDEITEGDGSNPTQSPTKTTTKSVPNSILALKPTAIVSPYPNQNLTISQFSSKAKGGYIPKNYIIPPPHIENELFSINGALLTASVNNFVYSIYRLYKKFRN